MRRAVGVATFNAWAVSVGAALSLVGGVASPAALALGAALAGGAAAEFRGRFLLRTLDDRAPRHLAANQVFVGVAICAYCAWSIRSAMTGKSSLALAAAGDPDLTTALAPIDNLVSTVTVGVYGAVIAVTLLVQALAAWYYLSRAGHIRRFRERTPPWIVELYRRGTLT